MAGALLQNPGFESYVEEVQQAFGVPALVVGVVDITSSASTPLSVRGFGATSAGELSADSVFCIASNTKLFVAVALGVLVDEGKLSWDSKIAHLLPDIRFTRQDAQDTVTVADLLSHQTGLSGHLSLESSTTLKLSKVVESVNHLRFMKAPREAWQYCNITFALAGVIIERLSGMSMANFIRNKLFEPLKMTQTTWTTPVPGKTPVKGSVGGYYASIEFDNPVLGYDENCTAAATGSILSTARDMALWMQWLLRCSSGFVTADDPDIISKKTLDEIITPRVESEQQLGAIPTDAGKALWDEFSPPEYGLAQSLTEFHNVKTASHNGTGLGAGSVMLWAPERGFGITVLTNVLFASANAAPAIILRARELLRALELRFGFPHADWIARTKDIVPNQQDAEQALLPPSNTVSDDLNWKFEDIAGKYYDPGYGDLHVILPKATNFSETFVSWLLGDIKVAHRVDPARDEAPHLLAALGCEPFFDRYAELWHIGGGIFWTIDRCILQAQNPDEKAIDMPVSYLWPGRATYLVFRRNTQGSLEAEKYCKCNGSLVVGEGSVTFVRVAD